MCGIDVGQVSNLPLPHIAGRDREDRQSGGRLETCPTKETGLLRRGGNWCNPSTMKTQASLLLAVVVWAWATVAWSQGVSPPPPRCAEFTAVYGRRTATAGRWVVRPSSPPRPAPAQPASVQPYPPGAYAPAAPPGAVMVAPDNRTLIPTCIRPPGPYGGPVMLSPGFVLVARTAAAGIRLDRGDRRPLPGTKSRGQRSLGYTYYNAPGPVTQIDASDSDDVYFPLHGRNAPGRRAASSTTT